MIKTGEPFRARAEQLDAPGDTLAWGVIATAAVGLALYVYWLAKAPSKTAP